MRPYYYIKSNSEALYVHKQIMRERGKKVMSMSFMFVGLSVFTYIGGYYYLWTSKEAQLAQKPGMIRVLEEAPASAFLPQSETPSSQLSNPESANASSQTAIYPTFSLSIPSLKINTATVTTDVISNNEDIYLPVLVQSLAHYKGTTYPGKEGNVVVYGHSILPAFYNPKNYLSIFSKLDTLTVDDSIFVSWGEDRFRYKVEGIEVVDPSDTRVLRYHNGKTLTLVTCVPPGYTTRRLLVFARLAE